MLPTQIITDKRRIETTPEKVFRVLAPKSCLDGNTSVNERTYALQCGPDVYEIICAEIQNSESKTLVIPEFLIPSRPYPIYVYIYGMVLYSSNPAMGQREAAERTRKRFDLTTFSHTTLGRAMKRLEALINTNEERPEPEQPATGRLPSVGLTRTQMHCSLIFKGNGR